MAQPIHIALSFTDNYWALAYAVMRSACLTTTRRRDLHFHLCHKDLTQEHRAKLDAIATEFGASLHHYEPFADQGFADLVKTLPASKRFPPIVYTRLLLDRLLPAEVERLIYLDCDTLVRKPIEALYELDLQGKTLGAVADPYHDGLKAGRDIREQQSPFDTAEPYFNSGVLLIDRRKLGAVDIPAKLAELDRDGLLAKLFFDQDILNYIFRGDWRELDWRFNVMMPRPAHETMGPAILHYTMFKHPWNLFSGTAFERTYRHVMTNEVFWEFFRERLKRKMVTPFARLFGGGK